MPGPPFVATANAWSNFDPQRIRPADFTTPARGPGGQLPAGGVGRRDFRWRQFDVNGERLDRINWQGEQLIPVQRDFTYNHPAVVARTTEECDMIRLRHGIEVSTSNQEVEIPRPIENLEETSFPDWAAEVLRQKSWKQPTPIQIQAWPVALAGYDLVGIAATGSGKTMAYVLPMLVHIMAQPELRPGEGPVGLVLLPTRELCGQVRREISSFATHTGLRCESIVGGEDHGRQGSAFIERVDIVVATPGRLIALLNDQCTNLRRVTYVVLDEADDLLDRGFSQQVELIMSQIRPDRQVLLFSATWQERVQEFARKALEGNSGLSPGTIEINVGGIKLAACKNIKQQFWSPGRVDFWQRPQTKLQALCAALREIKPMLLSGTAKVLIFCNKAETVPGVAEELRRADTPCEPFTTECPQAARERMLQRFRESGSDLSILVSTQVLGRGHDFHNVKYVINYDYPSRLVDYIHRIGRTGRMGDTGFALTLLEDMDLRFAKEIVDCLKETGHAPPEWLEKEGRQHKRWWRQWNDLRFGGRAATAAEGDGADIANPWRGRGSGRRHEFLAELGGLGLARVPTARAGPGP